MKRERVAVIDLGSNSFKLLVAEGGNAEGVFESYEDIRLLEQESGGAISSEKFRAGIETVVGFCENAREFGVRATAIVGTSVFRSATNAADFGNAIFSETGIPLRVLSGEEEAAGIARGVETDFLVRELRERPLIFDLGGGSLEFIGDGGNRVRSWQLGAVRLVRKFVENSEAPLPAETLRKIRVYVRETVSPELRPRVRTGTPIVFCGGVLGMAHRALAKKANAKPDVFSRKISIESLENLLARLSSETAAERIGVEGVPASRADIAPAALAVVSEVAAICGCDKLIYSSRNLRYGIAAQMLSGK